LGQIWPEYRIRVKFGIILTTNFDLKNITKNLGMKIKILKRDKLKNHKTKNSSKNKGSHCVCLYKNKYYFDPNKILPIKKSRLWNVKYFTNSS